MATVTLKLIKNNETQKINYSLDTNLKIDGNDDDCDFIMKIKFNTLRPLKDGTYLMHINNLPIETYSLSFNNLFKIDKTNESIKFLFKHDKSLSIHKKLEILSTISNNHIFLIDKLFYADDIHKNNFITGNEFCYYESLLADSISLNIKDYNVIFIKKGNKIKISTGIDQDKTCVDFDTANFGNNSECDLS